MGPISPDRSFSLLYPDLSLLFCSLLRFSRHKKRLVTPRPIECTVLPVSFFVPPPLNPFPPCFALEGKMAPFELRQSRFRGTRSVEFFYILVRFLLPPSLFPLPQPPSVPLLECAFLEGLTFRLVENLYRPFNELRQGFGVNVENRILTQCLFFRLRPSFKFPALFCLA